MLTLLRSRLSGTAVKWYPCLAVLGLQYWNTTKHIIIDSSSSQIFKKISGSESFTKWLLGHEGENGARAQGEKGKRETRVKRVQEERAQGCKGTRRKGYKDKRVQGWKGPRHKGNWKLVFLPWPPLSWKSSNKFDYSLLGYGVTKTQGVRVWRQLKPRLFCLHHMWEQKIRAILIVACTVKVALLPRSVED